MATVHMFCEGFAFGCGFTSAAILIWSVIAILNNWSLRHFKNAASAVPKDCAPQRSVKGPVFRQPFSAGN